MCTECHDTKSITINRGAHRVEIPCPACQTADIPVLKKVEQPETDGKCECCENPMRLTRDGTKIETWCEHCKKNHVRKD